MTDDSPMLATLRWLHDQCEAGVPPTLREMGDEFGLSYAGAHWRVSELLEREWIERVSEVRGWRVTGRGRRELGLDDDEAARLRERVRHLEDENARLQLMLAQAESAEVVRLRARLAALEAGAA